MNPKSRAMSRGRTQDQQFADALDCDIYRLIGRAEIESLRDKRWDKVVLALRDVRPLVRARMHPDDRGRTT